MLRAISLTKHFDLDPLFEDLDLTLSPGDRVGLVGPNGTGKSTLMRVLAGLEEPTSGQVIRSPGLTVGWQAQEAPDPRIPVGQFVSDGAAELMAALKSMRVIEARMAGGDESGPTTLREYDLAVTEFDLHGGWACLARMAEVRSRLGVATEMGIDADRPMGRLSGGEQTRVMLARLLVTDLGSCCSMSPPTTSTRPVEPGSWSISPATSARFWSSRTTDGSSTVWPPGSSSSTGSPRDCRTTREAATRHTG